MLTFACYNCRLVHLRRLEIRYPGKASKLANIVGLPKLIEIALFHTGKAEETFLVQVYCLSSGFNPKLHLANRKLHGKHGIIVRSHGCSFALPPPPPLPRGGLCQH